MLPENQKVLDFIGGAERDRTAEMLGVDPDSIPDYYQPRCNIAPTDDHFIVTIEYENRKAAPAK
jgi:hypothetical protein